MKVTKAKAVREHRKMWNWIADETEKLERIVLEDDYFEEYRIQYSNQPLCQCYCCEYTCKEDRNCQYCPIVWVGIEQSYCVCLNPDSQYKKLDGCCDWQEAAELARQIANLPERPDMEFDILEEKQ